MLSQGVWNEELDKWVRHDKKECCICENKYSTSPELFKVEFTEGEDLIYCNVCLGEGPLSEIPDEIKSITKVEAKSIKNAPQGHQNKESYSAKWLNNNKDNEGNEIDWVDSETLKEMKQFREEKLTNLIESLDLLHDTSKLEAFTAILTEEQRDKLYSHPILNDYDLLP